MRDINNNQTTITMTKLCDKQNILKQTVALLEAADNCKRKQNQESIKIIHSN